jgi:hypothetical protein
MRYLTYSNGLFKLKQPADVVFGSHQPGAVSAGTPITLPNSITYTGDELEVYLNDIPLENLVDFNYEGTAPRTQISFTFDLRSTDEIRYRINREIL